MHPNQSSLGPACLASCKASATLEFRIEGAGEIRSSDTRCSRDNHNKDTDRSWASWRNAGPYGIPFGVCDVSYSANTWETFNMWPPRWRTSSPRVWSMVVLASRSRFSLASGIAEQSPFINNRFFDVPLSDSPSFYFSRNLSWACFGSFMVFVMFVW